MPVNHLFSGRTPKESESITDCQDYFKVNEERGCFAIADGASQSFYSAIWAKLLVQHFCENPEISNSNWETWLEPIQAQWFTEVSSRVETSKSQGKPTWIEGYNGLIMHRSATSTFIGLRFSENKIEACIVGDSCLFIYRNRDLESYPLKRSEDFNDRPQYFASYSKDNHYQPFFIDIPLDQEQSDNAYIILATDALSEHILRCYEQKEDVLSPLLNISSQKDFENFVTSARHIHSVLKMKNDDVTLMILRSGIGNTLPKPKTDESNVFDLPEPPIVKIDELEYLAKKNLANLKLQRFVLLCSLLFSIGLNVKQFFELRNTTSISTVHTSSPEPSTPTETSTQPSKVKSEISPQPKTFKLSTNELTAGTSIFKDEKLTKPLIQKLSIPIKVEVIETTNQFNKIKIDLYAHKTTSIEKNCQHDNITLSDNIRSSPDSTTQDNLVGILIEKSTFKNLDLTANTWCKFRFEGYIAK